LRRSGSPLFAAEHRSELARFEFREMSGHGIDDDAGQRDLTDTGCCLRRGEERRSTLDGDQLLFDKKLTTQ
jgi:hypothetical protein